MARPPRCNPLSCGTFRFIWELHMHPFALHTKKIQCPAQHRPGWGLDPKNLKKK